ncbi:MAG: heme lyase CcmF/NrfE family subunit [Gammaproteobacteria bacterium]|nr:heme lyase CcmF/NrfE family subunit [Gammaproteobacteria bacterium]
MLPEIGHYCLIIALCLAIVQVILPMWGSFNKSGLWVNLAISTAYAQFVFIGISFAILAYSLAINDFSVAYVAQNSNTHLPVIYRICATWGAHEGSLLLWVLILSIWTALVGKYSSQIPLVMTARVLSILGSISVGFLLFLLTTSNPFQRLLPSIPLEGRDLNPLLQDPGLIIHPPMLYMGYVGFSVVFAFAIAALISGKFDAKWARFARPWTLIAWSFLTLGITLGSWWAYRVLGWGGWWFWDPVENASFLPWLSGTALIHSLIVAEKRNVFKAWTVLLAVCTFSLSLMGTFLVRSGILVSVHAFAIDPTRGAFILYFLVAVVGGSLLLYAWRGHTIQNSGVFQLWSRETMLLTNNVLLTSCMLTVLLGTIYPLIIDGLGLGKLSVGPPYFNAVFIPLVVPILFMMGIGPALHWKESRVSLVVKRFKYTLPISLLLALILPLWMTGKFHVGILIGLMLAFWVIIATLQHSVVVSKPHFSTKRLGMMIAHMGFGICVIGIVVSSVYSVQRDIRMSPNDVLKIGPYAITFEKVIGGEGPNYSFSQGQFLVRKHQQNFILRPEMRRYTAQQMALPKTAIHIHPFHDLYLALGEKLENEAWSMRVYYKPFIRWIWLGGLLMMLGGIIAAFRVKNSPFKEVIP